jgi:hypothetical protein
MDTPTVPVATGQPTAAEPVPQTVSAIDAALTRGDVPAFQEARRAEKDGKPLADVATPAKPATEPVAAAPAADTKPAAPVVAKGPKPKDLEADERARARAAEIAAPLQSEIQRLNAELAKLRPATEPAKAPAAAQTERFPSVEVWAAQPANEGKTFQDYLDARDDFRDALRETKSRTEQARTQHTQHLTEQDGKFGERMKAAIRDEPDLKSKIPAPFLDPQLVPASAVPPGQPITFAHIAADVAFYSDNPAGFLKYLHAHPDEVQAIGGLPQGQWHSALSRIDGRIGATPTTPAPGQAAATSPAADPAAAPSPISAAPAPAQILSRPGSTVDAKEAALARGDVTTFHRLRNQERLAARQG